MFVNNLTHLTKDPKVCLSPWYIITVTLGERVAQSLIYFHITKSPSHPS